MDEDRSHRLHVTKMLSAEGCIVKVVDHPGNLDAVLEGCEPDILLISLDHPDVDVEQIQARGVKTIFVSTKRSGQPKAPILLKPVAKDGLLDAMGGSCLKSVS